MFTGIIEEKARVTHIERGADSLFLTVAAPLATSDAMVGSSIAVDGVCLTACEIGEGTFTASVMRETLNRSTLSQVAPGTFVNCERPLSATARFGGHIVQGHVDGCGKLLSRVPGQGKNNNRWEILRIHVPEKLRRYIVEKGSIALAGVSLTVSAVGSEWFEVSLIPATLETTTLGAINIGESLNIEVDILAKYVESLLEKTGKEK